MRDRVFAIALARSLAPLQPINGCATEEKVHTVQVTCRDVERTKCQGNKHMSLKAKYLLGQYSTGRN